MGWNIALIAGSTVDSHGYFGTNPSHDHARAVEIINYLNLNPILNSRSSNLEFCTHLKRGKIGLGAYEKGIIVSSEQIIGYVNGREPGCRIVNKCCERYKIVFTMEIASGADHAAYSFYRDGELVRSFSANPSDGIIVDAGDMLPEEIECYAKFQEHETWDGVRKLESMAEDFAFALSAKVFGVRLDTFPMEKLQCESFTVEKMFWPLSLRFGRRKK